jgi:hypothetical protein
MLLSLADLLLFDISRGVWDLLSLCADRFAWLTVNRSDCFGADVGLVIFDDLAACALAVEQ